VRIAFITSSLEPGRDGVGDYTRRLAGELIRQGHPSIIVGLNDSQIPEAMFESQAIEGALISVSRLPGVMPWNERAEMARKWLDAFNPDWVSLQFVPFGFHPKGLPFGLPRHLKSIIGSRPLHWMFHELWVLWNFPLSLRKRLLGQLQKFWLVSCLKKVKPQAVATQLPLYKAELIKIGVEADVVPLHGNIPVYPKDEANRWFNDRCVSLSGKPQIKLGFFGNIYSCLSPALLAARIAEFKLPAADILVLSAGKMGPESVRMWNLLEQELKSMATFFQLGALNEREASWYFSSLDYGLTSYEPEVMGKSGPVAAMCEHGLQVISCGSFSTEAERHNNDDLGKRNGKQPWTVGQSVHCLLQQLQVEKT
jgi:hypothetical protein